jgi:hypothetical protein
LKASGMNFGPARLTLYRPWANAHSYFITVTARNFVNLVRQQSELPSLGLARKEHELELFFGHAAAISTFTLEQIVRVDGCGVVSRLDAIVHVRHEFAEGIRHMNVS